ncbi:MAG: flippase [Candidatus ainarchaeum sp.]|nr:flippase [Candidatus ainarchaeum sp.]
MEIEDKKTIAKNIGWLTFSKIFVYLLSIVTITLIPRYLGVTGYGQLNFALSFVGIFSIIANIGLGVLIFRDVSKNKKLLNLYFNNFFYLKLICIFLFGIIVYLVSLFLNKPFIVKALIIVFIFFNMIQSFSGYFGNFLNAFEKMKYESIREIILKLGIVIGLLFVIYLNKGVLGVSLSYVLGSILGLIFILYNFVKFFKNRIKFKPKLDVNFIKEKSKIFWPFALSGLFGLIYFNFDRFMISLFINDYQVGLYSIGYSFYGFMIGVIAIFSTTFFPQLSIATKSKKQFKDIFNKFTKVVLTLAVPLCFGSIFLSKEIILLVFGKDFVLGNIAFKLIMLFFLFNAINQIFNNSLNVYDYQRYQFKMVLIASIVNVLLNFIAIPLFGIIGAGITTIISEVIIFIGVYYKFRKDILKQTNFFRNLIVPFVSGIIMLLGIFLIKDILNIIFLQNSLNVLGYAVIGGLIYFICIFLFKYIRIKEILFLINPIINKFRKK